MMGPKQKERTVQRSQRSLKMTCSLTLAACFCVSAAAVGRERQNIHGQERSLQYLYCPGEALFCLSAMMSVNLSIS